VQRTHLQIGSGLDVEVADMRGYAEATAVESMRSEGLTPGRRGVDYADGVDAGHIVRTRPRNGSFVPMGSTVDYVVASAADRPPDTLVGDSSFVDHDATARLKHEAP
jgi:beta-lactam-binding protein with PASTA domain